MPREEFLEELTPNFPPKEAYSYDENARYTCERQKLMDEVLLGTFESYILNVEYAKFSYKITADEKFCLEVMAEGERWTRMFDYITDAFEIGEAAYRFFVAMPRALDEGEVLLKAERGLQVDHESREKHDHCEDEQTKPVEIINPFHFSTQGQYVKATVSLCSDGGFILSVIHVCKSSWRRRLLDQFYSDPDLAQLLAEGYVKHADTASPGLEEELYKLVYLSIMH